MNHRLPIWNCTFLAFGLASVSLVAGSSWAFAQESPPAKNESSVSSANDGKGTWVPLFQRHAGEYVVSLTDGSREEAELLTEPLLRWWQPVRGGDDGALYLWVKDGRPVAAVTFFTFKWPN